MNTALQRERSVATAVARERKRGSPPAGTTALEREIDARVYGLYALTPTEVQLVEEAAK